MRRRTIPIIRLRDSLIVSIQTELSDRLVLELKEEIAAEISRSSATGVVIELSGVDVVDSFIACSIRDVAQVARLMGSKTIVVGLDAPMSITLVEMGVEMSGVDTALNLDAAMAILDAAARENEQADQQLLDAMLGRGHERVRDELEHLITREDREDGP